MSREERQSLLHEGVSVTTTLSAYVEIVFDNSDSRFPTGKDEVVLRRTIGLKKDEYSLDKKSVNKADVMNLLESAGFSKSNPYYIVPQGRITSLTNAKDHERLTLLKEVAGTKVYEQRRSESLKLMEETKAKQAKIIEVLTTIQERLDELEAEKEELVEFQNKDKERRCLEYSLYQTELSEITQALEDLEDEREQEVVNAETRRKAFSEREKQIEKLETDIKAAKQKLSLAQLTKTGYDDELSDLVRSKTEIQCIIADLKQANERGEEQREALQAELRRLDQRITGVEAELMEITPEWQDKVREDREEKHRLDEAQARLQALGMKRGRVARYTSKAERDKFLKKEITDLSNFEKTQTELAAQVGEELNAARGRLGEVEAKVEEIAVSLDERMDKVKQFGDEIAVLREEGASLSEQRKALWREDTKLTSSLTHAREELRNAERHLSTMMDKDTGSGLRSIDNIVERQGLEGVYGPLYKLFEIPDKKYSTAVEITAGNSLFHVVVDSDQTATRLVDTMMKERAGRVTFIPLNRIKPKPVAFPEAGDAVPLLSKIKYNEAHEKAFQQVFGKTAVCQDLTIAAAYVRSHDLNTITLAGDKVDRKGALTGGYQGNRSRLDAIRAVTTWNSKYQSELRRMNEVKATTLQLDQRITQVSGQISALEQKRKTILANREPLSLQSTELHREEQVLKERIEKLENSLSDLDVEVKALVARRDAMKQEMASPLTNALSPGETREMEELAKEVGQRQKSLIELTARKNELGSRKNLLEIDLNESLRRRREELRGKLENLGEAAGSSSASTSEDLESRKRELGSLKASIDDLTGKINDIETESDNLQTEIQRLASSLENVHNQQAEDNRGISKQQKNAERYLTKRSVLMSKKDECNKNIRDLGVLPEEAFEKYMGVKPDRLLKRLHAVNEGLKKFAHVNKKAFEQYTNFTKQRDQLRVRRKDLDDSEASIAELIDVLDQRKDEAIERTFKQVSKNFEEVFSRLVPAGRGRLIMQKRVDLENPENEDEDDEDEDRQRSSIDNYTGVSIKVSFNSKVDEGLRIQQLSGGQKSLVALALVFAIQKCDPAPFYLFDEIDANLDAQYRTAVATMIHELSESAQFITTTFRPEMLERADKYYGVLFNNQKVSSISSISREEAQEFVDQEAQAQ
ncbi:Structural maintenance of chromosomes protein 3 [Tulasnella sp. 418]|nr:Structural maintenance of chromosomes protein 3 [Tulasnella sp. 418]